MLHLRFKAETGLEAGGGYYKTISVKPGVVERVWVSDNPRSEYVEWLEKVIETFEEKMRHPVYEIGGTLTDLKISKEQIEEFKKSWNIAGVGLTHGDQEKPLIINSGIEGQIIKPHYDGDVKVIDEFKITGVSINPNDDMAGYVKQD